MTKAEKILEILAAGKTITVATPLVIVPVKQGVVALWAKAGFPFFKTGKDGATWMIRGVSKGQPKYVCIDGAKVFVS